MTSFASTDNTERIGASSATSIPPLRSPRPAMPRSLFAIVIAILVTFGIAWLLHFSITSYGMHMDNAEQLVWVRSLEWGYFKHPPLVTWLLWPWVQIFGYREWVTVILGATVTLSAIGLMVPIAYRAGGRDFALIALLASLCVSFYNSTLNYYNHNIVLMGWVALSAYTMQRLLTGRSLGWWAMLGAVGGFGMLTKYSFALVAVPVALLIWRHRLWRDRLHRRGLLLATLVATLIVTPHLLWMAQHDFGPINYAMNSSLARHRDALQRLHFAFFWSVDWLFQRCLIALVLIGLALRGLVKSDDPTRLQAIQGNAAKIARSIILLWGFVPFGMMNLVCLLAGSHLQRHWGTAFFVWTVPAVMLLLRLHQREAPARRYWVSLTAVFLLLQASLMIWAYEKSPYGRFHESSRSWRQFPVGAVARTLAADARAELGGPIRMLVGPEFICGAIATALDEKPKVLIDGKPDISPWITPAELQAGGKIWIWKAGMAPPDSHPLPHGLRWSSHPDVRSTSTNDHNTDAAADDHAVGRDD